MHFRFYRKSAKGSEEVEEEMDQLQAQIREEAYGKRLNLAKDKKKKKEKTFLELAKGFWRVKNLYLKIIIYIAKCILYRKLY